jgi:two-component system sensor histidine kinase UhpB
VGGISDYGGGITGMRERALLVNGRFTVCTSPGGGTEVRLTVPLTPEHQR